MSPVWAPVGLGMAVLPADRHCRRRACTAAATSVAGGQIRTSARPVSPACAALAMASSSASDARSAIHLPVSGGERANVCHGGAPIVCRCDSRAAIPCPEARARATRQKVAGPGLASISPGAVRMPNRPAIVARLKPSQPECRLCRNGDPLFQPIRAPRRTQSAAPKRASDLPLRSWIVQERAVP